MGTWLLAVVLLNSFQTYFKLQLCLVCQEHGIQFSRYSLCNTESFSFVLKEKYQSLQGLCGVRFQKETLSHSQILESYPNRFSTNLLDWSKTAFEGTWPCLELLYYQHQLYLTPPDYRINNTNCRIVLHFCLERTV